MPLYTYQDPDTGETVDVVQSMNDEHKYEANGKQWDRVFTSPQASIDTKWDEFSNRDFLEKTRNKKGTVGDLYDKSKELSQKREEKAGFDAEKQKVANDYKKATGKEHPLLKERKKSVTVNFAKGIVK